MKNNSLVTHHFTVNKEDNGGEALTFVTHICDNGDKEDYIYLNTEIILQSYCNSVVLNLHSAALSPEILRRMADGIEEVVNNYKQKRIF